MKLSNVSVNFYGVNATVNANQTLNKVLIKLLQKTIELKKNSIVFCSFMDILEELDSFLWTSADWLPHALVTEPFREKQPILLSNELINYNNASYFFVIGNSSFEVLSDFEKISVIFNFNSIEGIDFFKYQWKILQKVGYDLKYFKQDKNGKFQNDSP